MSKSFSYGTVKAADVLSALHIRTRAERDFQEALYSYLVNWLRLKRESGSLHAGDLHQLNSWMVVSMPSTTNSPRARLSRIRHSLRVRACTMSLPIRLS